jgi:hypothetical protein
MEPAYDYNDHMRVEIFYSSLVIYKQLNRCKDNVDIYLRKGLLCGSVAWLRTPDKQWCIQK